MKLTVEEVEMGLWLVGARETNFTKNARMCLAANVSRT